MNAIFRKELKDILRWTRLGMIVIGLLCWNQVPDDFMAFYYAFPRYLRQMSVIGSGVFALVLGLLQSMFDLRTDARTFLLHRPISSSDIFRGKLAAGFVAHLLGWGIPMLLVVIYLESIGPEKLPVTWSDALLPALCCLVSFLFHPAAMWMACREARWIGTRCLPLVLAFVAVSTSDLIAQRPFREWGILISIAIVVVTAVVTVAGARHAFTRQTCLPFGESREAWSWSNSIGLTTASIVTFVVVAIFLLGYSNLFRQVGQTSERRLAVAIDGHVWELERTRYPSPVLGVAPTQPSLAGQNLTNQSDGNNRFEDVDQEWRGRPLDVLPAPRWFPPELIERFREFSSTASTKDHSLSLYERNGHLYLYSQYTGWRGTVTPRGIFTPTETPQGRFNNAIALEHCARHTLARGKRIGGQRIFADDSGIYQLDIDE